MVELHVILVPPPTLPPTHLGQLFMVELHVLPVDSLREAQGRQAQKGRHGCVCMPTRQVQACSPAAWSVSASGRQAVVTF